MCLGLMKNFMILRKGLKKRKKVIFITVGGRGVSTFYFLLEITFLKFASIFSLMYITYVVYYTRNVVYYTTNVV